MTHLLAVTAVDAGLHRAAHQYHGAALRLARRADDRHTYATHALRLENPPQATRLAEAALDTAGRSEDPALRAFLLTQRALARAVDGSPGGALTDLAVAERAAAPSSWPAPTVRAHSGETRRDPSRSRSSGGGM